VNPASVAMVPLIVTVATCIPADLTSSANAKVSARWAALVIGRVPVPRH
jgi:hypothetical protein